MKKVSFILILLCAVTRVGAQCDTLFWGDREPTIYYWDSNWVDVYDKDLDPCPELLNNIHFRTSLEICDFGQREYARVCYTDTAFRIIGVAAPVRLGSFDPIFPTEDSTILPEYYRLWTYSETDSTMMVRASARFDTFQPRYIIQTQTLWYAYTDYLTGDTCYDQNYNGRRFLPLYEAYFDQPVTVNDSFYVSMTAWNNYYTGTIENQELPNGEVFPHVTNLHAAHPCTYLYTSFSLQKGGIPIPPYYYTKYHNVDVFNHPSQQDTNWHINGDAYDYHPFLWLFPIFDTTGRNITAPVDTCPVPQNLILSDLTSDAAIFLWSQGYASSWDISIAPDGVEPDSGTIYRSPDPYYAVVDIEPETWYNVWVRTVCRNNKVSPWSDSIRFYVPQPDDPPIEHIPSVVDQYTYLYPNPASGIVNLYSSFRIHAVEVYSSDGRKVMFEKLNANSAIIDISALPHGTYYMRIETDHGPTLKHLVVQ